MYRRILVPLDGSELAEVPLHYAMQLAVRSKAEVVLLHVCGPDECHCGPEGCHIQPMHRVYVEHTAEALRHRLQEAGHADAKVDAVTLAGDPGHEILQYLEENDVSLVVMATHGRSGMKRWIMGSIATKVHRCSNTPIRLVRSLSSEETAIQDWPEKRILVLLDGSERAEQVLPYVAEHAKMSDAEVTLLRVCEAPLISANYPEAIMPLSWDEYVQRVTSRQRERCSAYFEDVGRRLESIGLNVNCECLFGSPAEAIISYVRDNRFNLVAMTSHVRPAGGHWPIGGVADKVIHGTSSPVLLVRPH